MSSRNRCKCGKVRAQSYDAARYLHARIWARNGGQPVFFYECQYHLWHWTSHPHHQRTTA